MVAQWHEQLCGDGWRPASEPFWETPPCFYDLGTVKTVILFFVDEASGRRYHQVYYWRYGGHDVPEYVRQANVERRRYKLHHSMNALMWQDHGDRPLWPE
jgi:hypothetical protein